MTIPKKTLLCILVGLALVGCSAITPQTPTVWPTSSPNPLTGTYWNLVLLKGQPLINGTRILLHFTEDHINGNAGCSDYTAPYYATDHQFNVGIFEVLIMLCQRTDWTAQENTEWMAQEDTYVNTFTMAIRPANYTITTVGSRTQLEILDADGQPVLVYEAITIAVYQILHQATAASASPTVKPTFTPTSTPTPLPTVTLTP